MQQQGLWETLDPVQLMRPMLIKVTLLGGASGPAYDGWRKRFVLTLSLMGMAYRAESGLMAICRRDGGGVDIKRRARVLDWLMAQADVEEVRCDWPGVGQPQFSVCVVSACC